MEPVSLFDLASKQARWLAVRQTSVAGNVANANTPGYLATDVEPFEKVLDRRPVTLAATQTGHFGTPSAKDKVAVRPVEYSGPELPSKNTVVLENELMKAGEIRRSFELNTAIVKAFHAMMMTVTKG
ncbi:MAG: flagellar basal body rod protein FlgB [Proteobacteria bacterium]|jgi:flagellar basal-body rod protein FlgB|nr:MAG: flagellar basal body rod protein FlgB [Pseudomonadota bacterium]